jgi:hypothetical protein
MTATHWPDGTPISTGNGFDLAARRARGRSIFYNPARTPAEAGKMGGALSASTVATVQGLSERAQAELNKAPKSITISTPNDAARRTRAKKASI